LSLVVVTKDLEKSGRRCSFSGHSRAAAPRAGSHASPEHRPGFPRSRHLAWPPRRRCSRHHSRACVAAAVGHFRAARAERQDPWIRPTRGLTSRSGRVLVSARPGVVTSMRCGHCGQLRALAQRGCQPRLTPPPAPNNRDTGGAAWMPATCAVDQPAIVRPWAPRGSRTPAAPVAQLVSHHSPRAPRGQPVLTTRGRNQRCPARRLCSASQRTIPDGPAHPAAALPSAIHARLDSGGMRGGRTRSAVERRPVAHQAKRAVVSRAKRDQKAGSLPAPVSAEQREGEPGEARPGSWVAPSASERGATRG
jgi:hypothetical protein